MVDFHALTESVFLENPIDLLFFAPHDVPIISISLLPLAIVECSVDTVTKRSLKFDVLTGYNSIYGGFG